MFIKPKKLYSYNPFSINIGKMPENLITRRNFIKAVGFGAAALALPGCTGDPATEVTLEEIANTSESYERGAVGSFKKSLYSFGGYQDLGCMDGLIIQTDEIFDSDKPNEPWVISEDQLPIGLGYTAHLVYGDDIFAVGGLIQKNDSGQVTGRKSEISDKVLSKNVKTGIWKNDHNPFPVKIRMALGVTADVPYVLGGRLEDGSLNLNAYRYDKASDKFSPVGDQMRDPIYTQAIAESDGKIYLFGRKEMRIYDTTSGEWSKKRMPKEFREKYSDFVDVYAFKHDNQVYVWTDTVSYRDASLTGLLFKLSDDSLKKVGTFRIPYEAKEFCNRAFVDGYVHFLGGKDIGCIPSEVAYRFKLPLKKAV